MEIKFFTELPKDAMYIRQVVFVDEQGFVDEFDEADKTALHIVMYDGDTPVATCRAFTEDGGREYHIGRMAVIREYRRTGAGLKIMNAARDKIRELGGKEIVLSSQLQAKGFYEKAGYTSEGDVYQDQDCPHILMRMKI